MLVFRLAVREALGALFHDEPARPAGSVGQDGVRVGDAAVADPLLAAGDLVPVNAAVLDHRLGRGLQGAEVAAGFRLGGAVGEQHAFFGDAASSNLLLLRRGADADRVAAQEGGQHGCGHAQVDARHLFADAVDVERAAAHAAEFFGNEQELNAQLVGAAHVRTISSGHSSRSSRAISVWSGSRFLANSRSDFKLSLRVLLRDHNVVLYFTDARSCGPCS